jgi:hypothetical protein
LFFSVAAGHKTDYTITATNTGAVRLKNITLNIHDWATLDSCNPALPGPILVHGSMECQVHYIFTQDFYEAGALAFVASAKANELNTAVESAPASVDPSATYLAKLLYKQGTCVLPAAREYEGGLCANSIARCITSGLTASNITLHVAKAVHSMRPLNMNHIPCCAPNPLG